jgi:hypothetical protein
MNTIDTLEALRRANPRTKAGFAESVDAAAQAVAGRLAGAEVVPASRPRRSRISIALVASATAAAVAVFLTVGSPGRSPGVESARAAVKRAVTLTAASAERSGTAVVQITHGGSIWAHTTIRWNAADVAVATDRSGGKLLVVDGMMYGIDPADGSWVELGPPESIDPDSGTTPQELLVAVREDVGGVTLRRITDGMRNLTASHADGGTVYRGTVAAGLIARESGFKEGRQIRVFPFGYVAHGAAADPAAQLDTAVTVGGDGIVREIAVSWGTWTYTVTYSRLGATSAPVAPEHARPLRR